MNLEEFRKEARGCKDCRTFGYLHNDPEYGLPYPRFHEESSCPTRIVVIGEAPNHGDTYKHKNLTWKDGKDPTSNLTRELLERIELNTSDVLFTNSVLCLPRKKGDKFPVEAPQREKCSKWLKMAIDCCDAKIVVTLGVEALNAVKLLSSHKLKLRESVGKAYPWNNRTLFPLYHPSKGGRRTRSREEQLADIQPLKEIISKLNLYTDKS